jgi:hypothetical protein
MKQSPAQWTAPVAAGVRCPVCGTALSASAPVVCELCETGHHRDCWEFLGRCSVYGCPGLRRDGAGTPPGGTSGLDGDPVPAEPCVLPGASAAPSAYMPLAGLRKRAGLLWFSPRGADIRLAPDELAVELPVGALPHTGFVRLARGELIRLGRIALALAVALIAAEHVHPSFVALAMGLAALGYAQVFLLPVPVLAWLVRHGAGALALEVVVRGGWLTGRGERRHRMAWQLRPLKVELAREWGPVDPEKLTDLYRLQYALNLHWNGLLPGELIHGDLIRPIPIPGPGQPRSAFLEALISARLLAQQLAAFLGVPYEELLVKDLGRLARIA